MNERTMTAAELLAECEAGRTAHMEKRTVRGKFDPVIGDDIVRDNNARPVLEDVLVLDCEVSYRGSDWWTLLKVCTDGSDPSEPVFVDTEDGRLALKGTDQLRVRDRASR